MSGGCSVVVLSVQTLALAGCSVGECVCMIVCAGGSSLLWRVEKVVDKPEIRLETYNNNAFEDICRTHTSCFLEFQFVV